MSSTCQTPSVRSRQYLSGPQIFWLVLSKQGVIGGSFWDILVQLPFPCTTFFIGSVVAGDEANSLWMSFIPLNKPRGTPFTSMTGQEQVFPLIGNQLVIGPHYYSVLRFKQPSNLVYFHMGSENGHLSRYSIGCLVDRDLQISGGLYF